MALVVKDRVKETTATTGTGTLTLAGAVTGFQSFSSALSNGDTTYYSIFESSTGEWEVGLGTFTLSGTTLSRDTILESSNAGSAINLTAGAADVFITQPAEKAVYLDASGDVTSAAGQIDISNFNNDAGYSTTTGTVTSIDLTAGTGISVSGGPITSSGSITVTNTAPDQTVVLTQGSNVTITGTYPNFTIASTDTTYSAGNGIDLSGTTFSVAAGGGLSQDTGGLSHADTSTQSSVDNSGATVIQDVTLDTYGHVTGLGSVTLTAASVGALATGAKAADSELLDGIDSSAFLRSNTSDQYSSGVLRVDSTPGVDITNTGEINGLQAYQSNVGTDALMSFHIAGQFACHFGLDGNINDLAVGGWSFGANKYRIWHAGNDGSGSGLDADLLDGLEGSSYGFKNIPQNSQSANYTLVLDDSGKHILHPAADTTARTFTIPANSSVAFPIGTAVTFINQNGAGDITIAITTDTLRLAGDGSTGSRTLTANGIATAVKVTSTEWIISGVNLA